MVPHGSRRSQGLSFDFVHPDQRLLGNRTLNLLNSCGDATLMRGVLYSEVARYYLPVPRYSFVRVVIYGEYWGVYVNAQQFNTHFVREHFPPGGGIRWRVLGFPGAQGGTAYVGDDLSHDRQFYRVRSRETPEAWADLLRLFRVLGETPLDWLENALEPLLDVDGVLRFLALDLALVNPDGYWVRGSDYSIYQDRNGRFPVLPPDINEGLLPDAS
jgi:spore coat protein CotH